MAIQPDEEVAARAAEVSAVLKARENERAKEKLEAAQELPALNKAIEQIVSPTELTEAFMRRGDAKSILGDSAEALRDYFEALDRAEGGVQIARIKMLIALELLQAGQRYTSLFFAVEAVDVDVSKASAWDVLGLVAGVCGLYDFAIHALRRAIELDPEYSDAILRLGSYLRKAGYAEESIEMLTRYVERHPHDPEGWYELGESTQVPGLDAKRHEKAAEFYRRALAENPSAVTRWSVETAIRDVEGRTG